MSLGNIHGIFSISNALSRAVLRENRLILVDSLNDCLEVADWIFEQGFLSRQNYNEIEGITSKMERAKKLIDILETKENEVLQALLKYFEKEKDKAEAEGEKARQTSLQTVIQKLKTSQTKFSSQFPEENPAKLRWRMISKLSNNKENIKDTKVLVDSTDFCVTEREVNVLQQMIRQLDGELSMSRWLHVAQNMIALDAEDISSIHDMLKREENWATVIAHTLTLWVKKNGKNATFFSLVGVFQEVRLYNISDSLLDNKDDIQNPKLLL